MSILLRNVEFEGRQQDVFIEHGCFAAFADHIDTEAQAVLDGTDLALLPSFHNCHTHAAMSLLRGFADDLPLHVWLEEHIWPAEAGLTEDDVYWGTRLACLEMIKSGTTFFTDMYWYWPAAAKAVEEMGMKAALSAACFDFGDSARRRHMQEQIQRIHAFSRNVSSRIRFLLGPHALYTVSEPLWRWLGEYAEEHSLLLHTHLSETEKEVKDCIAAHGLRPVFYLESLGVLGPHVSVAHGVWLDDDEMTLLAERGVQLIHCPASNMKLCSGSFAYARKKSHGLRIALGTDGCASNNALDMFSEMRLAALLAKLNAEDPTVLSAPETLALATEHGAQMFGLDSGKIALGKSADCILVKKNSERFAPGHNFISDLVYSAHAGCVDTTICQGNVLMHGGVVKDEDDILKNASVRARTLVHRIGI